MIRKEGSWVVGEMPWVRFLGRNVGAVMSRGHAEPPRPFRSVISGDLLVQCRARSLGSFFPTRPRGWRARAGVTPYPDGTPGRPSGGTPSKAGCGFVRHRSPDRPPGTNPFPKFLN